ncbi:MAG: hypothetical protein SCARUB_00755 [Candidatus Scalindua rubra]|uniref:RNA polymerase sigma factor n=1 Tax=Candidatus Scalindua rubra TaxID=1872076 RepID=A0A1E3XEM6_9BACT|nr:MAG: hypothetical protein SCARUB_00755 [Candidatus Scalindua rubra]
MDNDELIELQKIIKRGGPEAEDAARRFCDGIKDAIKRMLSSISYKHSQEYLEWGINEAFLAFRDNWDPKKGKYFKVYLWRYVKERVRMAIAKDKGKESSIDAPFSKDDDEETDTIKDVFKDNELSPEDTYKVSELSQILTNTFNGMDSKIQIIMIEYFANNSTSREIGQKLDIVHTTVMRNLNERGIKPLRNEIENFF